MDANKRPPVNVITCIDIIMLIIKGHLPAEIFHVKSREKIWVFSTYFLTWLHEKSRESVLIGFSWPAKQPQANTKKDNWHTQVLKPIRIH